MEEFETLSNSEKQVAIRSKIKNIQYIKYNVELDIIMENSVAEPNTSLISELNNQLLDLNAKNNALQDELDEVLAMSDMIDQNIESI